MINKMSNKDKLYKSHIKLNKQIEIELPNESQKGFLGYQSSSRRVFKVPPLNAVIESKFGKAAPKSMVGFQAGLNKQSNNISFLNWVSIGSGRFDDPNNYRDEELLNFKLLKPINQDCCGACWAVSSAMAFAERYGISNDSLPIDPSIISIMSCCTKHKHKNVFKLVDTPDCDIMSSYEELISSDSTMGMCSGGIPYSAGLTIMRNGLPNDNNTKYTSELFGCNDTPSFVNMNTSLIEKYKCEQNLFNGEIIKAEDREPVYISASKGSNKNYIKLMKEALLEGGPIVTGYMVLGDFLGMGTDAMGLGINNGDTSRILNWDSTGKVYVPGAYDNMWPGVSISSVGGSGLVDIQYGGEKKITKVFDKGLNTTSVPGEIFCGFHAVVIVGWGELDMKYVKNKNVKTVIGSDGNKKLPFWICRNSWGEVWPLDNYYQEGIMVMDGSQEKKLEIPPGYWLHAMYPNESMAMDVPINYEGTYYGSTMVMFPKKDNEITKIPKGSVDSTKDCNTSWVDSEGYSCKEYGNYNWCNSQGKEGEGWNKSWGLISDFSNNGYDATEICCECGDNDKMLKYAPSSSDPIDEYDEYDDNKSIFTGLLVGVILSCLAMFIILFPKINEWIRKSIKKIRNNRGEISPTN